MLLNFKKSSKLAWITLKIHTHSADVLPCKKTILWFVAQSRNFSPAQIWQNEISSLFVWWLSFETAAFLETWVW